MDKPQDITPEEQPIEEASRYAKLQSVGQGGSAFVFKAFDTVLQKTVCLKVGTTPAEGEELKDVFYRFEKEARILSSMNHPNIVQCYELTSHNPYGETFKEQETPIIVLQYIQGMDLYNFGRECEYDYARIVDIATQIARALNYAHNLENRVLHRDIKGTNIIINNEGHVYLIDFGISKLGTAVKTTMHRFGTSGFIAPEILENYIATDVKAAVKPVDARADLYSLGCLLYFLVTKKLPFPQKPNLSIFSILEDQKNNKFIPVEKADENCPALLVDLIHKLMAYDRELRPANGKELLADLLQITKKIGVPSEQFLDLKTPKELSPQDFSLMRNNYDVFVKQNNEDKIRYFQSLDTMSDKPNDPKTPQRIDRKFLYGLVGAGCLFFIMFVFYFMDSGSSQTSNISTSINSTPVIKQEPVQVSRAEGIKEELDKTPTSVVALKTDTAKKKTVSSAPKEASSYQKRFKAPAQPRNNSNESIDFGDEMTLSGNNKSSRGKKYGVVESSTFSAILSNKVITSDLNAPVTAILNEDIVVKGKVIIPSQSKIIGTARSSNTDRVSIRFSKFILNNNKTIPFSGIAMDDQGATGIAGKVDREKSKRVARGGGNVMSGAGSIVLDTVTGSSVGGRILNDAGDEMLDQVDDEVRYHTNSTTVIEVQSGVPFKLYISRDF
jgi:serine/threonine protein kinase